MRLVDSDGQMLGIVSIGEARIKAEQAGLDLVEISPTAKPPVCKILDYGKFRYEIQKKAKEARKNQKVIHIKEIKLSVNIGEHDYGVKMRAARKFIEDGDKVKVTLKFKGREMSHKELGDKLVARFVSEISDIAKPESPPRMEGKQLAVTVAPAVG